MGVVAPRAPFVKIYRNHHCTAPYARYYYDYLILCWASKFLHFLIASLNYNTPRGSNHLQARTVAAHEVTEGACPLSHLAKINFLTRPTLMRNYYGRDEGPLEWFDMGVATKLRHNFRESGFITNTWIKIPWLFPNFPWLVVKITNFSLNTISQIYKNSQKKLSLILRLKIAEI